jgi:two-component system, NarL family, response regulator DegU
MQKINICLADDHQIFRKAMLRLLKTFERTGEIYEASNGEECLNQVKKNKPHVVLLDLEMPVMNGTQCAEQLLKKFPDIKIIILTMHDSEKYMMYMLELGVHSFLLKNTDPEELEKAIYSVVDLDFYHNDLLNAAIHRSLQGKARQERPTFNTKLDLSEREKEVLKLICDELSHKEIAERLNVSEKTVHAHKHNIQTKLGIKSTVGLVKVAIAIGLTR